MTAPPYAAVVRRGVARSHPSQRDLPAQIGVLLLALLVGALLGLGLLAADRSSWSGAVTRDAVVTGRSHKGVLALAGERQVVLHLARIPAPGTRLAVEVAPDGRARPTSYRQRPARALRSGVLLCVGLALLVQLYRLLVTRRQAESA